jgi:CheY-like chemotaxis protein
VKTHGGAVHVRSQLGEGTTFSILLPASDSHPESKPTHPKSAGESRSILIVDDQTIVRDHIARVLERRGFQPLEANDTKTCLKLLESSKPALILMDMSMPDGSGAEIATELRRRGIATPIILTSGYVPESQLRSFDPGLFQGFLQKPYTLSELDSTIERVLGTPGRP